VAILGLGWAAVAAAAEPSLEVSFDPRKFGIEDVARLVVRVNEPGEGQPVPNLGQLENLELVSGPSVGTEFSWINGRATRATNFTYVLQGREVGPAAVGPIVVTIGGTELRSEVVQAEVVAGSVAPPRSTGRRSPFFLDPFADPFARGQSGGSAARVVLRQLVSAKKAVLGEPVIATIVLDTTAGVDGFEWVEAPSYPGWWAQRVEPPERVTSEPVEVDGLRYDRFIVGRNVLVPLKTGELEVPEIRARIGFRSRSVFAAPQVVERSAPASMVEIEPRPEAPKGFSGAVGNLRYSASLEPTVVDFGESAVLSIELEGSGNLPLVDVPAKWPACADCETYPPEEESQFTVDASGIHGSRAWQMTIVPRSWGSIDFEPVMLAVFDPAAGIYRKQTLGPLHLEVTAPPPTPTPPIPVETPAAEGKTPTEPGSEALRDQEVPEWAWIVGALLAGLLGGGLVTLFFARRRLSKLPPRRPGESPAERARELQTALERWWLDARSKTKGKALEEEMNRLRRDLEAVRFAPGRADHTQTVAELEERVRALIRRA
jgi:hypothetical protein